MSLLAAIKNSCRQAGKNGASSSDAASEIGAPKGSQAARALKQTAGFTLTEALATVIIVGLVTTILAGGITLATKQYTQSMANSEAQMLYSSLQKILDTELRFTKKYTTPTPDGTERDVTGFESKHYIAKSTSEGGGAVSYTGTSYLCTVTTDASGTATVSNPDVPGQLAMASEIGPNAVYNPLLGSGAYNYGLTAKVETFTYNTTGRYFTIKLTITQGSSNDAEALMSETFTVKALNNPQPSS